MTGELKQTRREGWRVVVTTARANYACMCAPRLTPVLPHVPPAMDQTGKVHTHIHVGFFYSKELLFFFFLLLYLSRPACNFGAEEGEGISGRHPSYCS